VRRLEFRYDDLDRAERPTPFIDRAEVSLAELMKGGHGMGVEVNQRTLRIVETQVMTSDATLVEDRIHYASRSFPRTAYRYDDLNRAERPSRFIDQAEASLAKL